MMSTNSTCPISNFRLEDCSADTGSRVAPRKASESENLCAADSSTDRVEVCQALVQPEPRADAEEQRWQHQYPRLALPLRRARFPPSACLSRHRYSRSLPVALRPALSLFLPVRHAK